MVGRLIFPDEAETARRPADHVGLSVNGEGQDLPLAEHAAYVLLVNAEEVVRRYLHPQAAPVPQMWHKASSEFF